MNNSETDTEMRSVVHSTLTGLEPQDAQHGGPLAVFPLIDPKLRSLRYLTMAGALQTGAFHITEVDAAGSVPVLRVQNDCPEAVLLLDGEEVAGAKQNRVFNATILVPAKATINVPVSCTEQGRWQYSSPEFGDSGHVMPSHLRMDKKRHVIDTLRRAESYVGSQSAVWANVDAMHREMGTSSRTSAMKDSFDSLDADLKRVSERFSWIARQSGIVVFVLGRMVGLDYLSSPDAFRELYPKLIRSYVLDGIRSARGRPTPRIPADDVMIDRLRAMIDSIRRSTETMHESVGLGTDFRYSSSDLVGSALVHEKQVAHMAFFPFESSTGFDDGQPFASLRQRRGFRGS